MDTKLYTATSKDFAKALNANVEAMADILGADLGNLKTAVRNAEAIKKMIKSFEQMGLTEAIERPTHGITKYDETDFVFTNVYALNQAMAVLTETIEWIESIFADLSTTTVEFNDRLLDELEENENTYHRYEWD